MNTHTQHAPEEAPPTMVTGTVKWFNNDKGYGFIRRDDGEPDVFVHVSQIDIEAIPARVLEERQHVEFDVGQGRKGLEAQNVRPAARVEELDAT